MFFFIGGGMGVSQVGGAGQPGPGGVRCLLQNFGCEYGFQ